MRCCSGSKGGRRSKVLTAAWAILVALAPVASQAESPPVRPAPPERAPDAKSPVKIFGAGTFRPLAPAVPTAPGHIQPLSHEQKSRLIGRDAGSHHVTLTIANPVVQGKASLAFSKVPDVDPLNNMAIFGGTDSYVQLRLNAQANRTYWIEVIVGRSDAKQSCEGFVVQGPDKSTQTFGCTEAFRNKKDAQHLLFGFSAAASTDYYFALSAKQATAVLRFEITAQ